MKYKEYLKYLLVIPTVGVLLLGNYLWNLKIDSRIDKKLQSNVKVGYNGEIVQPYNLVTDNTTTSATSTNWLGSIRPSADSSFDLGSSSLRWRNIYSSGTSTLTNLVLNGNVGINSSSPIASLAVQGVGGTNPFSINSSTGASLLSVLQNGYVGIGTSSPDTALSVSISSTASESVLHLSNQATTAGGDWYAAIGAGNQFAQGYLNISQGLPTGANYELQFQSNGAVRARSSLSAPNFDQNITGVGDSPVFAWTNTGGNFNGYLSVGATHTNAGTSGSNLRLVMGSGTSTIDFRDWNNNIYATILRSNGNFGIGTTSPLAQLSVQSRTVTTTPVFDVASSSGASFLRIISNGNVGINSSSPIAALSVNAFGNTTGLSLAIVNSTATTTYRLFDNGHIATRGVAPTLSSCQQAGTAATIIGNDNAGIIAMNAATSTCTMTFATAWTATPACTVSMPTSSSQVVMNAVISNTSIVFSTTSGSGITGLQGSTVAYRCMGIAE